MIFENLDLLREVSQLIKDDDVHNMIFAIDREYEQLAPQIQWNAKWFYWSSEEVTQLLQLVEKEKRWNELSRLLRQTTLLNDWFAANAPEQLQNVHRVWCFILRHHTEFCEEFIEEVRGSCLQWSLASRQFVLFCDFLPVRNVVPEYWVMEAILSNNVDFFQWVVREEGSLALQCETHGSLANMETAAPYITPVLSRAIRACEYLSWR